MTTELELQRKDGQLEQKPLATVNKSGDQMNWVSKLGDFTVDFGGNDNWPFTGSYAPISAQQAPQGHWETATMQIAPGTNRPFYFAKAELNIENPGHRDRTNPVIIISPDVTPFPPPFFGSPAGQIVLVGLGFVAGLVLGLLL